MIDPIKEDAFAEETVIPNDETDYEPLPPAFSGKLWNLFPDGTVEYDGQIGLPSEFPLTEAELAEIENAGEPFVEPPLQPDYLAFWEALLASGVYVSIKEQSMTSLPMNTLSTEFIALLGDAKQGHPREAALQASMQAILDTGTFTPAHLVELQDALDAGNLSSIYTIT